MKLRIHKQNLMYLEDILLDVYTGLPLGQLEGDLRLRTIIDGIQEKLYGEDYDDLV